MQEKEKEMRAGGREKYAIQMIESAGNTLERMLVNTDPFDGNQCEDENCLVSKSEDNKINCRKNNVGYLPECWMLDQIFWGNREKYALPVQGTCQQV